MRIDVSEAVSTCKLCLLCRSTNKCPCFDSARCFVISEDIGELEAAIVTNAGALQLNSHHLVSTHIDRRIKRGCKACCSVNGRERRGEYEGEGEKGGRERDCSVVVYVSLRSCVGRSAPSRHCCCCEKDRTKDSPCYGPLIPLPAQLCCDHTLMECY